MCREPKQDGICRRGPEGSTEIRFESQGGAESWRDLIEFFHSKSDSELIDCQAESVCLSHFGWPKVA
jgi:hypothetical protein